MGYFQVRYNSRVVNYDRRGFIRLATVVRHSTADPEFHGSIPGALFVYLEMV